MWALDALGLEADADERAVKRAYAQRLKTTRPEVDAAAFQQLHDTYQAALAYLRYREEAGDEEEAPAFDAPSGAAAAPPPPDLPREADLPPAPPEPPLQPPRPAPDLDLPPAPDEGEIIFTLDAGAFVADLQARARGETPEAFAAWLMRTTADWPLGVRPGVAAELLPALLDPVSTPTLAHFDAIARAFELDDVTTRIDPLRIQRARQQAIEREAAWWRPRCEAEIARLTDRGERMRYLSQMGARVGSPELRRWLLRPYFTDLFARDARALLHQRVAAANFDRAASDRMARRLTGWSAPARALWVRAWPGVPAAVQRFIAALDGGRVDALSPAISPRVLAMWDPRAAGDAKTRYRPVVLAFFVLFLTFSAILGNSGPGQRFAPPWRSGSEQDRAQALLNRAVSARESNDEAALIDAEKEISRAFGASRDPSLRLAVANTRMLTGMFAHDAQHFDTALTRYNATMAFVGSPETPDLEEIVAIVRVNRADVLSQLDRPKEALDEFDRFLASPQGRDLSNYSRMISNAMDNRGFVLADLDRTDEAIRQWDACFVTFRDSADEAVMERAAECLRGKAAYETGEPALADFAEVIKRYGQAAATRIRATVAHARLEKAEALRDLRRYAEALAELDLLRQTYSASESAAIAKHLRDAATLREEITRAARAPKP